MWDNISADIQNYLQTMSLSHKLYHSVLKLIGLFSSEPEHSEIQGVFRENKYIFTNVLSEPMFLYSDNQISQNTNFIVPL